MSELKNEEIPQSIYKDSFSYSYKETKKMVSIHIDLKYANMEEWIISIDKNNLDKIIKHEPNTKIEYKKVSNKDHICNKNNIIISSNNIQSSNHLNNLVENLIRQNLEKSLLLHNENLKNNNLKISQNQVKKLLQKLREEYYPNDDSFLLDICNIRITFNDNKELLKNIPFCYINSTILNEKKIDKKDMYYSLPKYKLKKLKNVLKYLWMGLFILVPKIITSYIIF